MGEVRSDEGQSYESEQSKVSEGSGSFGTEMAEEKLGEKPIEINEQKTSKEMREMLEERNKETKSLCQLLQS
jgi:hypothetical protein